MMLHQSPQSGFTLVELLVYIAISSLLILSLTAHIVLTNKLENRSEIIGRVTAEVSQVESVLETSVRAAASIVSPAAGTSADELVLEMKDGSLGNATFGFESGTITREDATQSVLPLTSDRVRITNLSFTNVTRSDTPGSLWYSYTYEWTDEEGQTLVASSSDAISLR